MTIFYLPPYDDHSQPHYGATVPQITLLLIWLGATGLWIIRRIYQIREGRALFQQLKPDTDLETGKSLIDDKNTENVHANGGIRTCREENGDISNGKGQQIQKNGANEAVKNFSVQQAPPTFDQFLLYIMALGIIMFFFFLSDYRKVFPSSPRVYSRDTFLFLVFLLFLVGIGLTLSPCPDKILNRDQTEEWKGWMQVMFVWYHYFAAAEWYNWIRIYIAAYVWMTGFGNFSFFWIKKDFSLWRTSKMLWRLNFLVLVICASISNEYMLYYICAMHTYWFLSVYATMAIFPSWNSHRYLMPVKFAIYAIVNALLFDIPGNAEIAFTPLFLLLGFNDGHESLMHEWAFRGGLDHWVCFIGMLCAYNYPHFEAFLKAIENPSGKLGTRARVIYKALLSGVFILLYGAWHNHILPLEKLAYNKLHPYTSWIPVLAFIVHRNLFPALRTKYISLFCWLGKITLETYLSQLHIYLQSNAKGLVEYIPGYPLLNFALATGIYLCVSNALFNITIHLSSYLLPKDTMIFLRNIGISFLVLSFSAGVAFVIKQI